MKGEHASTSTSLELSQGACRVSAWRALHGHLVLRQRNLRRQALPAASWIRPWNPWVFRTNVTADFGIVTGNFGPS
jgi:hypothetical protein